MWPAILLKKETLAQVFSCESCEIFENTFYYKTLLVAAFEGYSEAKIPDCQII